MPITAARITYNTHRDSVGIGESKSPGASAPGFFVDSGLKNRRR
jgi:hypothetical protein